MDYYSLAIIIVGCLVGLSLLYLLIYYLFFVFPHRAACKKKVVRIIPLIWTQQKRLNQIFDPHKKVTFEEVDSFLSNNRGLIELANQLAEDKYCSPELLEKSGIKAFLNDTSNLNNS